MPEGPIRDLTELTAPDLADLLVSVDSPGASPATKKMALSALATLTVSTVVVQVKTVGSGTYTPTASMKKVLAIGVGGGGGGAGGVNTDSAGGGGGGGGSVIVLLTAAQIGASKAYVVGAGGATTSAGTATTLDTAYTHAFAVDRYSAYAPGEQYLSLFCGIQRVLFSSGGPFIPWSVKAA